MRVTKVTTKPAARAKAGSASKAATKPVKPAAAKAGGTKSTPAAARRSVPLTVGSKPGVKRDKSRTEDKATSPKPAAADAGAPAAATAQPEVDFNVALRRAHQRMTDIFAEVMQRYDISPSQFEALSKIADLGPLSQSQLERQMALAPAELLALVGRLNRRGLVRPFSAPGDARQLLLDLSVEARAVMAEMKKAADMAAARMLAPLDPQDAKTLAALLSRLG
jgi:DNA-binding MarR family transcriptional regulator